MPWSCTQWKETRAYGPEPLVCVRASRDVGKMVMEKTVERMRWAGGGEERHDLSTGIYLPET